IFQGYVKGWKNGQGKAIPLVDNFRSREGILNFVNSLFQLVMREELGGLSYDATAQLRFGAPAERQELTLAANPGARVELHLLLKSSRNEQELEDEGEMSEVLALQQAEKEARLVALRLRELKAE